jgi:hypothetical protein
MPEIVAYCPKCRELTKHKVRVKCQALTRWRIRGDYMAVCLTCGDEIDLDDPKIIRATIARKGGPENRV